MAIETLKGVYGITNLDLVNPTIPVTSGMANAGAIYQVDDYVAATSVGMASIGSSYRMVRFPTQVKIKSVEVASDGILDSSATTSLVIDFNIAFSDSTIDGTPSNYQGLIPTTANTGAVVSVGTYTGANILFGSNKPTTNAKWLRTNVTFAGSGATYPVSVITLEPLWQIFGFVAAAGQPQDPGGNFDLLLYVSTAAGTAHTGNIWAGASYVK